MIDNRFSIVLHPNYQHLVFLKFRVDLPNIKTDLATIRQICEKQYPEFVFDFQGFAIFVVTAKFPDGQYAYGMFDSTSSRHIESILFSITLHIDSIMSAVCGFKNHIKPLQLTVNPAELSTITPEEFLEIVSDMYAELSIFIKVAKVSWTFQRIDSTNESVYMIQPIEYNYV